MESEAVQRRARLPDAVPPAARFCEDCDDPIAAQRLRAVPTATRCVDCEERALRSRHAFGGRL